MSPSEVNLIKTMQGKITFAINDSVTDADIAEAGAAGIVNCAVAALTSVLARLVVDVSSDRELADERVLGELKERLAQCWNELRGLAP